MKQEMHLLPNYFKKIGLVIIILVLGFTFFIELSKIKVLIIQKETAKTILINSVIIGLIFIALAKEKLEDEQIMSLRFKAMGYTFLSAVLYIVIISLFNLILGVIAKSLDGQELVLAMLIAYFPYFFMIKKWR
jgi:hypothetical protein